MNPARIDWLVVHYSSQVFLDGGVPSGVPERVRDPARTLVHQSAVDGQRRVGFDFRAAGRAAVPGRLEPGQKIFCIVPESGRFLFGYMLLTVVDGGPTTQRPVARASMPRTEPPSLRTSDDPLAKKLVRQLAEVWFDFEARLRQVPIVARMYEDRSPSRTTARCSSISANR